MHDVARRQPAPLQYDAARRFVALALVIESRAAIRSITDTLRNTG
jgi:hypothetical protein